jgi:hypothetical protein
MLLDNITLKSDIIILLSSFLFIAFNKQVSEQFKKSYATLVRKWILPA